MQTEPLSMPFLRYCKGGSRFLAMVPFGGLYNYYVDQIGGQVKPTFQDVMTFFEKKMGDADTENMLAEGCPIWHGVADTDSVAYAPGGFAVAEWMRDKVGVLGHRVICFNLKNPLGSQNWRHVRIPWHAPIAERKHKAQQQRQSGYPLHCR